ncbi:MAG: T9SS type A sorting domain-containing protein [Bacteroidales bacterium]|nr:T9SS type A sorting domain-containing protein [Bacteroidales bacterium]
MIRNLFITAFFLGVSYYCAQGQTIADSILLNQPNQHFNEENILSEVELNWMRNLPRLEYQGTGEKETKLPSWLNNAEQPYFRPIFNQGSAASCGQASGVSYNFTYEINRARNLPSDVPENQYPTHFHWNFSSGGDGWFGSSYFHSFEILRTNGSPNIADYGGIDYGGDKRWMSGYNEWYRGMFNRIEGVYTIDVSTPEGLQTLKHWLHNHLDGSEIGGVASFYANSPFNLKPLPAGTPEASRLVIANWAGLPAHAMVVVGYNDSIRWDYNGDGQYTNHLDINGDGVVDMRDWEIGGLLFGNSYGDTWANKGFAYMMYKTLADDVFDGGIWEHSMHVLKVKSDYSPLLTAKITLKHTSRRSVKVQLGIAADTSLQLPEHTIEFPMFNFQGGINYMQGGNSEEDKTIEFGLDMTPLLDFIEPGQKARYFLQVFENDPANQYDGELVSFSIIDYSGEEPEEYPYPNQNILLINNGKTTVGISAEIDYERVSIQTTDLPALTPNESMVVQMEANGGLEPYKWSIKQEYSEHYMPFITSPEFEKRGSTFSGWGQWQTIDLDFSFPFFDTAYEQITAFANGFIMFKEGAYPYPYWLDPMVLFNTFECVAPFMARELKLKAENNDTIWFEPAADHIRVNWMLTYEVGNLQTPVVFSAILFEDGRIEYHYEAFSFAEHCKWVAGVSKGDKINYHLLEISGKQELAGNTGIGLSPVSLPNTLSIGTDGILTCTHDGSEIIYDILVQVSDNWSISDEKSFQLTDAVQFLFEPGQENLIAGSSASIDVTVKNISPEEISDLLVCFNSPEDGFILWNNPCYQAGSLLPGEIKQFTLSDGFTIAPTTPENYLLKVTGVLAWNNQSRIRTAHFKVKKASLGITNFVVHGATSGILEPGNMYNISIGIANSGNAIAENVIVNLVCNDPFVILYPPLSFDVGDLLPLNGNEITASIGVHSNAPKGYMFELEIELLHNNLPGMVVAQMLSVGNPGILIVDLDPNNSSSALMLDAIRKNNFTRTAATTLITDLSGYNLLMVCLGVFPYRHVLTVEESTIMEAFLMNGGNIYMEGASTWKGDPRRPVHDMFKIQGFINGWPHGIDSLVGNTGTFADNLTFKYQKQIVKTDDMQPMDDDAFVLFTDMPRGLHYAIANENETYKTIGATFKFNGIYKSLSDTLPVLLMKNYLDFFGFNTNRLTANFTADAYEICDTESVGFSLKTAGNVQAVSWEFEGGSPAISNEFSPVIRYDEHGKFSVRLIVSDGIMSDTLFLEEIITVNSCTGIPPTRKPAFTIYPNPASDHIRIIPVHQGDSVATIRIFNVNGQMLEEIPNIRLNANSPFSLDVSDYRSGIYFMKIAGSQEVFTARFIISR